MTENDKELLVRLYEDAFDKYGECIQIAVAEYWENHFEEKGEDVEKIDWEHFNNLDRKLKVKFYYEGEE